MPCDEMLITPHASNAGSSVSVIMPTIFSIYPVAIWKSDTRYQTA